MLAMLIPVAPSVQSATAAGNGCCPAFEGLPCRLQRSVTSCRGSLGWAEAPRALKSTCSNLHKQESLLQHHDPSAMSESPQGWVSL